MLYVARQNWRYNMFADAIDFPGSGISEFSSKVKIGYHGNSKLCGMSKTPQKRGP